MTMKSQVADSSPCAISMVAACDAKPGGAGEVKPLKAGLRSSGASQWLAGFHVGSSDRRSGIDAHARGSCARVAIVQSACARQCRQGGTPQA